MTNGRKLHYPRANNYLQLGRIHVFHYSDLPQKERKSLLGWPVSFLSEILFQVASFGQETADGTTAVWLEEEYVGTKKLGCTGAVLSKVLGVAPRIEEQTMWALWNTTRGSTCRQRQEDTEWNLPLMLAYNQEHLSIDSGGYDLLFPENILTPKASCPSTRRPQER